MDARLTVTFDDGRVEELTAGIKDQLAWEKAAPGRSWGRFLTQMVNGETLLQDLYSLAFATMRRQGLFCGSLKELEESAVVEAGHRRAEESTEDEAEESAEDPTQRGPSTTP